MNDLISRQAAIDATNKAFDRETLLNRFVRKVAIDAIKQLPSAQPTIDPVKHGKWELAEDGWYCSACELYPPFDCDPEEKGIPYCPYCGARMERSDDEAD